MDKLNGLVVEVYKNLHRNLYSVRHAGKVIAHVESITLINPVFRVQPAGRAKVVATGVKNVHAYVKGTVHMSPEGAMFLEAYGATPVGYNPKKYDSFVTFPDEAPIKTAKAATLTIGAKAIAAYI